MVDWKGRWLKFNGKGYKHKASFKTKAEAKVKQKRWGGRLLPLQKSNPDYAKGYRYGLWMQG